MPNPSGPDREHTSNAPGFDPDDVDRGDATDPAESDAETTEHVAAPDDIANAALFMVSDKASHITGQSLIIDGGWTSVSPSPF